MFHHLSLQNFAPLLILFFVFLICTYFLHNVSYAAISTGKMSLDNVITIDFD